MLWLCAVTVFLLSSAARGSWPPSSSSGFSDCSDDIGVGLDTPFRIIAAADWDNNQKVDLVAVDAAAPHILQVWTWDSDNHRFLFTWNATLPSSVVAGTAIDVNRDGCVDVVVALDTNLVFVVMQNTTSGAPSIPQLLSTTPLDPLSVNLVNLYDPCARPWVTGVDATTGVAVAIALDFGPDQGGCNFGVDLNSSSTAGLAPIPLLRDAQPYSAATDLSGDCAADVILSRRSTMGIATTEYYVMDRVHPSKLAINASQIVSESATKQLTVPVSFGRPTLADWNGDGAADFLFPACLDSNFIAQTLNCTTFNYLVVVANQVSGLCGGDDCCGGGGSWFENVPSHTPLNMTPGVALFNLSTCMPQNAAPLTIAFPTVVIRDGDYNDDGVLDAVLSSSNGPLVLSGRGDSVMFDCMFLTVSNQRGVAVPVTSPYVEPLFFDIDDDGRLDLLTTITDVEQAKRTRGGVYAFWGDSAFLMNYYLTAMTINGASTPQGFAWGANVVGATHRFQYIDINQNTHTATATQATSCAANALQQPRAHFGLAITFSYITNYATGYALMGGVARKHWPVYLMPNSQVVVIAAPNVDPDDWSLKLFLYGQRFMKLVLYAWLTSLAVIGLPLVTLKLREVQADRRELHRHE